ncbi:hypothetical protein FHX68_2117 [Microbacterium lacticum]|uniref:Uncharacterized protein n=2 Tax=Microbacterium lacticum TaxID=33885 RepID=A0A4Y3ULV6_9MICO|nr:hypothetical protein FHX68_2117 [Microbacterium lacticum]GEB95941.1 hypothetical protein MLA01_21600 [Microbacterium lacticum]GGI70587.1 hypothetical protein GCM10009724_21800 [Microbacterium lacticum]
MASERRPTDLVGEMKQTLMVGALEDYRTLLLGNHETAVSVAEAAYFDQMIELVDGMLRDLNADG